MLGLNVAAGQVTYEPVARDQGLEFTPPPRRCSGRGLAAAVRRRLASGAPHA